jgi:hypothetical protein
VSDWIDVTEQEPPSGQDVVVKDREGRVFVAWRSHSHGGWQMWNANETTLPAWWQPIGGDAQVMEQREAAFALLQEIVSESGEGFMLSLDTLTRARELLDGHAPARRVFRLVPLGENRKIVSHPALEVTDLPGAIAIRLRDEMPVDEFMEETKRLERFYGGDRQVLIVNAGIEFLELEEV